METKEEEGYAHKEGKSGGGVLRNYSILSCVSTCKQDTTIELLVFLTHFLF